MKTKSSVLSQLETQLNSLLPEGTIDLNDTRLNIPVVGSFLQKFASASNFHITKPIILKTISALQLKGVITFLNLNSVDVVITFGQSGKNITFSLQISLPKEWKFSQSFPSLTAASLPSTEGSFFDRLGLSNSTFILSNYDYQDEILQSEIAQGLNFYSNLALTGPLAQIQALQPDNNQSAILQGLITVGAGTPNIQLEAALPSDIIIGGITISQLQIVASCEKSAETSKLIEGLRFSGHILVADADIELIADLTAEDAGTLELEGKATQGEAHSLPEFLKLVGESDIAGVLPASLNDLKENAEVSAKMGIVPAKKVISHLNYVVQTTLDWEAATGLTISSTFLSLDITTATQTQPKSVVTKLGGTIEIGGVGMETEAEVSSTGDITFSGTTTREISLSDIAQYYSLTFPPEVPDLSMGEIQLNISPNTRAFDFKATTNSTEEWPFGVEGFLIGTVSLELKREAGEEGKPGQFSGSFLTSCNGPITVVEGLDFQEVTFNFSYDGTSNWELVGSISATLFEADYTLKASLSETPKLRVFKLVAENNASELVNFDDGAFVLKASRFAINIIRDMEGGDDVSENAKKLNKDYAYYWELEIDGGIKVGDYLSADGKLLLYDEEEKVGLKFKASAETAAQFPLLPAPSRMAAHIALDELAISGEKDAATGKRRWSFEAEIEIWFSGLMTSIQNILSGRIKAHFIAESNDIKVTVDRLFQPERIPIPSSHVGSLSLDFGDVLVDASNFELHLSKELELSLNFGAGLPAELNNVFGTKDDGTPSLVFFNTYVQGHPETVTQFKLGIDSRSGLNVQLVTSPIVAITIKDGWCDVNLGDFGEIKLMLPIFSYSGNAFSAKGAFEQVKPIKLPLTPLKLLLEACGFKAFSDKLPKGLPLQEFKAYDPHTKQFNFDILSDAFKTLGIKLDSSDLEVLKSSLNNLPDRFKSYFDVIIPKEFSFDISVTAEGNVSAGVSTDPTTPIKFLYPGYSLLGPTINGLELYGFSFGEVFGGTLFDLKVDFVTDYFDLATLIASLILPLDQLPILPKSQDTHNTLTVHNLAMLILYETGIPVPIPYYFERLAYSRLGLEGLDLNTDWNLNVTKNLEISKIKGLFAQFENFFTKRDYLLSTSIQPGVDVTLSVTPNYIQLPQYLGGKRLSGEFSISAYETMAHLLNSLKTLSLNELVEAVPLEYRVGNVETSFGPIDLNVAWLVTTPEEFHRSYTSLKIPDTEITSTLQLLPPNSAGQVRGQGLVVFLKGGGTIANVLNFEARFGLIGTTTSFDTGVLLSCKISDLFDLLLQGTVHISAKETPNFGLQGASHLSLLGKPIFNATSQVLLDRQHFAFKGHFDLLGPSSILQITGDFSAKIDNQGQLFIKDSVTVALQDFILEQSLIQISNNSLVVSGTYLGAAAHFSILVQGQSFSLTGSVSVNAPLNVQIGPIYDSLTGIKVVDSLQLKAAATAGMNITLGSTGFAAGVSASFVWNNTSLKIPDFSINASPRDIEALANRLGSEIQKAASAIFGQVYKNMADWLKAGLHGLVQLTAQLQLALEAARGWSETAWNSVSQWSVDAWNSASKWSATAWNATKQWPDEAWQATATWSSQKWKATENWSDDTWNSTKTWTKGVWNDSKNWTTEQFNNVTSTIADYMRRMHVDSITVPHGDSNIASVNITTSPHGDTYIPAVNYWTTPHVDTSTPGVDKVTTPHVDQSIPSVDTWSVPHGDTSTVHVDETTPHGDSNPHTDIHWDISISSSHTDTRGPHIDTPTAHVDTGGHIDTPAQGHIDTPQTHTDVPTVHVDTPSQHVDTPAQGHIDTPQTHTDVPAVHVDTPAEHVDTPSVHVDTVP